MRLLFLGGGGGRVAVGRGWVGGWRNVCLRLRFLIKKTLNISLTVFRKSHTFSPASDVTVKHELLWLFFLCQTPMPSVQRESFQT